MRLKPSKSIIAAILSATLLAAPVVAQNPRVHVGKRATAIPKVCELIVPASIEGQVDVAGLLKEAKCKGAGDMMIEYTFVMNATRREKDKKGQVKEETTTTYEVYIPTLKGGTNARGILLVTSRDGVPVSPEELAKEHLRAGERLEKEENRIARQPSSPRETNSDRTNGMLPLGMYPQVRASRSIFGIKRADALLVLQTFLDMCELKLTQRERINGRETLVFSFAPRPGAQFNDNEKYVALLNGTIWIDAQDRIVTRLAGWPSSVKDPLSADATTPPGEKSPAVYLEMIRLPEGVWLPSATRLNGADYPTLFDGLTYDTIYTTSEYKRFSTETKDVELETPKSPL
jgi:hypothetical protein